MFFLIDSLNTLSSEHQQVPWSGRNDLHTRDRRLEESREIRQKSESQNSTHLLTNCPEISQLASKAQHSTPQKLLVSPPETRRNTKNSDTPNEVCQRKLSKKDGFACDGKYQLVSFREDGQPTNF
jgi:hypothetical protein